MFSDGEDAGSFRPFGSQHPSTHHHDRPQSLNNMYLDTNERVYEALAPNLRRPISVRDLVYTGPRSRSAAVHSRSSYHRNPTREPSAHALHDGRPVNQSTLNKPPPPQHTQPQHSTNFFPSTAASLLRSWCSMNSQRDKGDCTATNDAAPEVQTELTASCNSHVVSAAQRGNASDNLERSYVESAAVTPADPILYAATRTINEISYTANDDYPRLSDFVSLAASDIGSMDYDALYNYASALQDKAKYFRTYLSNAINLRDQYADEVGRLKNALQGKLMQNNILERATCNYKDAIHELRQEVELLKRQLDTSEGRERELNTRLTICSGGDYGVTVHYYQNEIARANKLIQDWQAQAIELKDQLRDQQHEYNLRSASTNKRDVTHNATQTCSQLDNEQVNVEQGDTLEAAQCTDPTQTHDAPAICTELERNMTQMTHTIDKLKTQLTRSRLECEAAIQTGNTQTALINDLQQKLERQLEELDAERKNNASLQRKVETMKTNMKTNLHSSEHAHRLLQQKLDCALHEIQILKTELNNAHQSQQDMEQAATAQINHLVSVTSDMTEEIELLNRANAIRRNKIDNMESINTYKTSSDTQVQQADDTLSTHDRSVTPTITDSTKPADVLRTAIQHLRSATSRQITPNLIDDMTRALSDITNDMKIEQRRTENALAELAAEKERSAALQQSNLLQTQQLEELDRTVSLLGGDHSSAAAAHGDVDIVALRCENDRLRANVEEMRTALEATAAERDAEATAIQNSLDQLHDENMSRETLTSKIDNMQEALRTMAARIVSETERTENALAELAAEKERSAALQQSNLLQTQQLEELDRTVSLLGGDHSSAAAAHGDVDIVALRCENDRLRANVEEMRTALEATAAERDAEATAIQNSLDQLHDENMSRETLTSKIDNMQEALRTMAARIVSETERTENALAELAAEKERSAALQQSNLLQTQQLEELDRTVSLLGGDHSSAAAAHGDVDIVALRCENDRLRANVEEMRTALEATAAERDAEATAIQNSLDQLHDENMSRETLTSKIDNMQEALRTMAARIVSETERTENALAELAAEKERSAALQQSNLLQTQQLEELDRTVSLLGGDHSSAAAAHGDVDIVALRCENDRLRANVEEMRTALEATAAERDAEATAIQNSLDQLHDENMSRETLTSKIDNMQEALRTMAARIVSETERTENALAELAAEKERSAALQQSNLLQTQQLEELDRTVSLLGGDHSSAAAAHGDVDIVALRCENDRLRANVEEMRTALEATAAERDAEATAIQNSLDQLHDENMSRETLTSKIDNMQEALRTMAARIVSETERTENALAELAAEKERSAALQQSNLLQTQQLEELDRTVSLLGGDHSSAAAAHGDVDIVALRCENDRLRANVEEMRTALEATAAERDAEATAIQNSLDQLHDENMSRETLTSKIDNMQEALRTMAARIVSETERTENALAELAAEKERSAALQQSNLLQTQQLEELDRTVSLLGGDHSSAAAAHGDVDIVALRCENDRLRANVEEMRTALEATAAERDAEATAIQNSLDQLHDENMSRETLTSKIDNMQEALRTMAARIVSETERTENALAELAAEKERSAALQQSNLLQTQQLEELDRTVSLLGGDHSSAAAAHGDVDIVALRCENDRLRANVEEMRTALEATAAERDAEATAIQNSLDQLHDENMSRETLTSKIDNMQEALRTMAARIVSETERTENALAELAAEKERSAALQQSNLLQTQQLEELDRTVSLLGGDHSSAAAAHGDVDIVALRCENDRLRANVEEMRTALEATAAERDAEATAIQNSLDQLHDENMSRETLTSKIDNMQEALRTMAARIVSETERTENALAELAAEKERSAALQQSNLLQTQQLEELDRTVSLLGGDHSSAAAAHGDVDIVALRCENDRLRANVEEMRTALEATAAERDAEATAIQNSLDQLHDENMSRETLTSKIDNMQEALRTMAARIVSETERTENALAELAAEKERSAAFQSEQKQLISISEKEKDFLSTIRNDNEKLCGIVKDLCGDLLIERAESARMSEACEERSFTLECVVKASQERAAELGDAVKLNLSHSVELESLRSKLSMSAERLGESVAQVERLERFNSELQDCLANRELQLLGAASAMSSSLRSVAAALSVSVKETCAAYDFDSCDDELCPDAAASGYVSEKDVVSRSPLVPLGTLLSNVEMALEPASQSADYFDITLNLPAVCAERLRSVGSCVEVGSNRVAVPGNAGCSRVTRSRSLESNSGSGVSLETLCVVEMGRGDAFSERARSHPFLLDSVEGREDVCERNYSNSIDVRAEFTRLTGVIGDVQDKLNESLLRSEKLSVIARLKEKQRALLSAAVDTLAGNLLEERNRADELFLVISDVNKRLTMTQAELEAHQQQRAEAITAELFEAQRAEQRANEARRRVEEHLHLVTQELEEERSAMQTLKGQNRDLEVETQRLTRLTSMLPSRARSQHSRESTLDDDAPNSNDNSRHGNDKGEARGGRGNASDSADQAQMLQISSLQADLLLSRRQVRELEAREMNLRRTIQSLKDNMADLTGSVEETDKLRADLTQLQLSFEQLQSRHTQLVELTDATEGHALTEVRSLRQQVRLLESELSDERQRCTELELRCSSPGLSVLPRQEAFRTRLSGLSTMLTAAQAQYSRHSAQTSETQPNYRSAAASSSSDPLSQHANSPRQSGYVPGPASRTAQSIPEGNASSNVTSESTSAALTPPTSARLHLLQSRIEQLEDMLVSKEEQLSQLTESQVHKQARLELLEYHLATKKTSLEQLEKLNTQYANTIGLLSRRTSNALLGPEAQTFRPQEDEPSSTLTEPKLTGTHDERHKQPPSTRKQCEQGNSLTQPVPHIARATQLSTPTGTHTSVTLPTSQARSVQSLVGVREETSAMHPAPTEMSVSEISTSQDTTAPPQPSPVPCPPWIARYTTSQNKTLEHTEMQSSQRTEIHNQAQISTSIQLDSTKHNSTLSRQRESAQRATLERDDTDMIHTEDNTRRKRVSNSRARSQEVRKHARTSSSKRKSS